MANLPVRSMCNLKEFIAEDRGALTVFGLYLFVVMAIISGVAIDYSNLITARTQLQVTADAVAHAALYNRDKMDAADAKVEALALVEASMPAERFGLVISEDDIVFGDYDYVTDKFTADEDSRSAVLVTSSRLREKTNAVTSLMLQLVAAYDWNVGTRSIAVTFRPTCLREGFVADGVVDIQSNNGFSNGFCIHSNAYVSLNSNNTFEAGTIISMPDTGDIDLPGSGWKTNTGLKEALREGAYRMRLINNIEALIDDLRIYGSRRMPSYITSSTIEYRSAKTYSTSDFVEGRIHVLNCSSATIDATTPLSNVVIVANCPIKFANSSAIENVIVATTDTSSKSINSPQNLRVGRDDACAAGGGAQLITLGSMDFAAGLQMYGGQLIAKQDINFAANADGIMGASMIAGGSVDGTSNMQMGFCGSGMENSFEAEYFRIAR